MRKHLMPKAGLALGGGAARGVAHVGVLRTLESENIPVDIIVGTSMGAIIGGGYAATLDSLSLERKVRDVLTSEEFRNNRLSYLRETREEPGGMLFSVRNLIRRGIFLGVSNLRPSFLSGEEFTSSMDTILPDIEIAQLRIPYGAVSLDIAAA